MNQHQPEPGRPDPVTPTTDPTYPTTDGEATVLARFFGRTLAVTGDVARAASRGTFAVF